MIKFLKKVVLFFALMAVIDVACGFGFDVLKKNAKGGDTRKNYYIAEECCDDILILGSSRAARHYDPALLEDFLGMTCYNCGEPGCGIITAYARYKMVVERNSPKIVIYEVLPRFDYLKGEDYSKYLGRVRQYSNKPVVRAMFLEMGDNLEYLRLFSNMYRNNSFFLQNIMDNLQSHKDNKGFEPLFGFMKPDAKYNRIILNNPENDSIKLHYLEMLITELQQKDTKLFFVVSPKCISEEDASKEKVEYEPIIAMCMKYGVPFINYTYMEGISDNYRYFHDRMHLNQEGASAYTKAICKELGVVYGGLSY